MINIYTDGACKDNNRNDGVAEGKGGWAFIVLESDPGYDMKNNQRGVWVRRWNHQSRDGDSCCVRGF